MHGVRDVPRDKKGPGFTPNMTEEEQSDYMRLGFTKRYFKPDMESKFQIPKSKVILFSKSFSNSIFFNYNYFLHHHGVGLPRMDFP